MQYTIETLFDNGSGIKYNDKEKLICEISSIINTCIENGATYIDFQIDSDSSNK